MSDARPITPPSISVTALDGPTPPVVPERVRTVAYFLLFGVTALVLLVTGITPIWFQSVAQQVVATGGVLSSVIGFIAGGLGVAYRPTAGR